MRAGATYWSDAFKALSRGEKDRRDRVVTAKREDAGVHCDRLGRINT
jgi:hypothetical protein